MFIDVLCRAVSWTFRTASVRARSVHLRYGRRRACKEPNGTVVRLGFWHRRVQLQFLHASAVHGKCLGQWGTLRPQSTRLAAAFARSPFLPLYARR